MKTSINVKSFFESVQTLISGLSVDFKRKTLSVSASSVISVSENACVLDESNSETFEMLATLRRYRLQLEKEESALIDSFKEIMGDAENLYNSNGLLLATYKRGNAKKVFDEKTFKTEHPEIYSQFIIEKEGTRPFLVK